MTMPKVVYFHRAADRITTFLRLGVTGQRQLETPLLSGRLPARPVLDASAFARQGELVGALVRLEKIGDFLENLHETEGEVARAPAFADIPRPQANSRAQGEGQ
jgi:hypothetical protein